MKKPKQLPAPKSANTPDKTGEKQALQKYTREETKNKVLEMFRAQGDLNEALYELGNDLLPRFIQGTKEEQKEIRKTLNEKVTAVLYGFEADTNFALMESFSERFRGGAKEICLQFIRDFGCKTDSEKILAETAAIAFMRFLDASRRLNNCLELNDAGGNKVAFMAMVSKERDRAHRQYLSTVSMIKQLKAPAIEMNIKTNTAFVSQNQQINAPMSDNPQKPTDTENNEAK